MGYLRIDNAQPNMFVALQNQCILMYPLYHKNRKTATTCKESELDRYGVSVLIPYSLSFASQLKRR